MEVNGKTAEAVTPAKDPQLNRSKISEISKCSENSNPNVASPGSKLTRSPAVKSATKTQKSAAKNPNSVATPMERKKLRERKFVVAKKNARKEKANPAAVNCKCKVGGKSQKCLCVAYEILRASQEEFFSNRGGEDDQSEFPTLKNSDRADCEGIEQAKEKNLKFQIPEMAEDCCSPVKNDPDQIEVSGESGSGNSKRRRDKLMEEARECVPDPGSGRVKHLVKAFEKLLTIPKSDSDENDEKELEDADKGIKWPLPGFQPPKAPETQVSSSSFCPSDFFLTSESLGLDSRLSSSLDSCQGSISSRTSCGGRRSRRNSSDSCSTFGRRRWIKRQQKATCQKPFKLRTEQRGRSKEEEFIKKVQEMIMEEEKQRVPIAQGLPWTTDEPECLVKPPVKEITRPIDLVLHSDIRAVERADFDQQVAEKLSLIEQYKMERERQQKLAEEEEIRRLRKELVPKAQPMPYFDRPFIPRRSEKHPTIPKEPRFHIPQNKKMKSCTSSWNDLYMYHHH